MYKKLDKLDLRRIISETLSSTDRINEEEKGSAVAGQKTSPKIPTNIRQYRKQVDIQKVNEKHLEAMDKVLGDWAKQNAQGLHTLFTTSYDDAGERQQIPFKYIQNQVTQKKGPARVARDVLLSAVPAFESEALASQLLDVLPKKS